jgi:hypothetical protein
MTLAYAGALTLSIILAIGIGHGLQQERCHAAVAGAMSCIMAVSAAALFGMEGSNEHWIMSGPVLAIVFIASFLGSAFIPKKLNRSFAECAVLIVSRIFGNWSTKMIIFAFVVSILMTLAFSHRVDWENQTGFWYGFYQSWTSGFVAFLIFGLAGILVSIHRPSEDHFRQRVANLFSVADAAAIDYLSEAIQKVGYYNVEIESTYKIIKYDPDRKAYEIMITRNSRAKNFLHDVSVPDQLVYKICVDDDDALDPPLNYLGQIVRYNVDGRSMFENGQLPMSIPVSGIDIGWPFHIAENSEAVIDTAQTCFVKAGKAHQYFVNRFTKSAKIYFEYCISGSLPSLTIKTDGHTEVKPLAHGSKILGAYVLNRLPGVEVLEFTIGQPP